MPLTLMDDYNLWVKDEAVDFKIYPDAYAYTNKKGGITLEFKDKKIDFFLDDYELFVATLTWFNICKLDCDSKMEGYTWPSDWKDFINKAFNEAWKVH